MAKRELSAESRWKMGNGKRGKKRSAAAKKKTSKTLTGRPKSLEHRQNIANAKIGHTLSEKTKLKISATKRRQSETNKKRKQAKDMLNDGFSSHDIATLLGMTVSELLTFIYD